MESNNRKLQDLIKNNPSVWDCLRGLRTAYVTDFRLMYNVSVLDDELPNHCL
jgi:hypothetical protein